MDKIGKNLYKISIGNTVKANPSAIAFLWKNWHFFYQLYPDKISAELVAKDSWIAKGFNTRGEIYLLNSEVTIDSGKFDFFSIIKYRFFKSFKTKLTLEYTRVSSELISYYLTTQVKLPPLFKPFIYLLHKTSDAAAVYINVIGADASTLITSNPEVLKTKCGIEAYNLYMEFLDEEKRIKNGDKGPFVHFLDTNTKENEQINDPLLQMLEEEIKEFDSKAPQLFNDLKTSLKVFKSEPQLAITKNRKILELIIKDVLHKERIRDNSITKLSDLCFQLQNHWTRTGRIDINQNILNHMTTIRNLGNTSTHIDSTTFLTENYRVSFIALQTICKWYLLNYYNEKKV